MRARCIPLSIQGAGLSKNESGILMLNYGWDYNAQSWTAQEKLLHLPD